jgi:hypothetical protein
VHTPKTNGTSPLPTSDKAEKEKAKKKEKKELRKERERVERDTNEGGANTGSAGSPAPPPAGELSTADGVQENDSHSGLMSPATDSAGARTPTSRQQKRNPWTIFMRMSVSASEDEIREFFGEAKEGVSAPLDNQRDAF